MATPNKQAPPPSATRRYGSRNRNTSINFPKHDCNPIFQQSTRRLYFSLDNFSGLPRINETLAEINRKLLHRVYTGRVQLQCWLASR